jgi:hypothetical protein
MHCFDGVKALNWNFLKCFAKEPTTVALLVMLVVAVMLRDLLLWVCMGDAYLRGED